MVCYIELRIGNMCNMCSIQTQGSQAKPRFDITPNGQQIHIAFGPVTEESSRFSVESQEALLKLQKRVFEHFEAGGKGAPRAADKPGAENSGMLIHDRMWSCRSPTDGTGQVQRESSIQAGSLQEIMLETVLSSACEALLWPLTVRYGMQFCLPVLFTAS
jgi:hypothetical protein